MKKTAKSDSKVQVHYTGTLEDGTTFDSSEGREPLEFTLGAGQVIKGFNDAVVGMSEGEEKTVTLKPADAYGEHHEQLVFEVPLAQLKGVDVKPGVTLLLRSEKGNEARAVVKAIKGDAALLDLNHPLAGETLTFKIKLVKVLE